MTKKYSKNIVTSTLTSNIAEDMKAEDLLKTASYYIDAKDSSASGQIIDNLGTAKELLPTNLGSSTSSDSNDPTYLPWTGNNYIYNPGIIYTNYLLILNPSELNITGSLDIRMDLALDSWTAASNCILIGKEASYGNLQYSFRIDSGYLKLFYRQSGDTAWTGNVASTVIVPFTANQRGWVRATLNSTNRNIIFYTSLDGVAWTQLGTTITGNGTALVLDVTAADFSIFGSYWTSCPTGKFYRAQIFSGINGTKVLDIDSSIAKPNVNNFKAITGQTVYIYRPASGKKIAVVTQPCWLFGTDDYLEVDNRYMASGNYLYLPGINGNYASIPDSSALDVTGDIDIRVKVAFDDWTPDANNELIAKMASNNNRSWRLLLGSNTYLAFYWSADGTNQNGAICYTPPGILDGTAKWVRVTLDVDNGASGNEVKFYLSDDGLNWTQLGLTTTNSGVSSIYNSTSNVEIGSAFVGIANFARGKFYRAQIYNGISGTLVMDANFETKITSLTQSTFTESSSNAATVTINRSGSTYRSAGITTAGYLYPGSSNTFMPSAINHLSFGPSDSSTILIVGRQLADAAGYSGWITKGSNTDTDAWSIFNPSTNTNLYSNNAYGPNYTLGQLSIVASQTNRSTALSTLYINSIAGTPASNTIDTTTNFKPLRIGSFYGALYADIEVMSAAVFRRLLTTSEISLLTSYFQRRES
jgi:hypothetical protein